MESRVVGRGGGALMLHVVDKGRALPWAWRVRPSPTGPGPEARHMAMVARLSAVIPAGATVVVLGDGECAGPARQATRSEVGGSDGCRTAMHTTATWEGAPLRLAV